MKDGLKAVAFLRQCGDQLFPLFGRLLELFGWAVAFDCQGLDGGEVVVASFDDAACIFEELWLVGIGG